MKAVCAGAMAAIVAFAVEARTDPWFLMLSDVNTRCVQADPAPAFPASAREAQGGVVRVRLTFTAASDPPLIDIFTNTAGELFGDIVRARVLTYRWTCPMTDSRAVVVTQEFQFVAEGRLVVVGGYWRSRETSARETADCERVIPPGPSYPSSIARRRNEPLNGAVLVELTFASSDKTTVKVLTEGAPAHFTSAAREHAGGYRLKCSNPSTYPVVARVPYSFVMEGTSRYEFRPSTLKDFLGAVETIDSERVRFDFNTMGCPFDVEYESWVPFFGSMVWNDGAFADDRREFVEWLSRLRLKITNSRMQHDLAGRKLKVTIPCLVLNLL